MIDLIVNMLLHKKSFRIGNINTPQNEKKNNHTSEEKKISQEEEEEEEERERGKVETYLWEEVL